MSQFQDAHFPGNPFAEKGVASMTESARIANAIELLAFEVRTATMLEASKPVVNANEAGARHTRSVMELVVPRLGLGGFVQTKP